MIDMKKMLLSLIVGATVNASSIIAASSETPIESEDLTLQSKSFSECCKRGPRGYRGHRGHHGHRGPTGPTGPTGATGATGATGPAIASTFFVSNGSAQFSATMDPPSTVLIPFGVNSSVTPDFSINPAGDTITVNVSGTYLVNAVISDFCQSYIFTGAPANQPILQANNHGLDMVVGYNVNGALQTSQSVYVEGEDMTPASTNQASGTNADGTSVSSFCLPTISLSGILVLNAGDTLSIEAQVNPTTLPPNVGSETMGYFAAPFGFTNRNINIIRIN